MQQRLIRNQQQEEAIDKGETVGQIVRGMQPVPQQVKIVDDHAEPEQPEQPEIGGAPPRRNGLGRSKNRHQQHRQNPAVHVGQVARADGRLHGIQMLADQVKHAEVGSEIAEIAAGRRGLAERHHHRHQNHHGEHAAGQ